ncbi:MAG: zinc ribbon domain-containing protein [Candidatus Ruminococcus intestinipullorum]|nr:zinc ribbon domain-containing protein [Candidatus Ruminococcus intestinipullorum]
MALYKNSDTLNNRKNIFCSYCGTKLDSDARFCKNCGVAVATNNQTNSDAKEADDFREESTKRKSVYEGYIHKCPSCGEVIEGFVANCPTCGHEIRDTQAVKSVRELALKLEMISAQRMPVYEEKKSVMKMVFGRDFKEDDEIAAAQSRFEKQKVTEKASLIINFSIPNTKEDILEFILLASSNINVKFGICDEVSQAWIAKLDQVYKKAYILMGDDPKFIQIKEIYERKKKEIYLEKYGVFLLLIVLLAVLFIIEGMVWNPIITILILIGVVALLATGFNYYWKNKRR